MGSYILCQVKRASMPYYIENISTNIYSIEELCYYFYHNIYLLDETILNEHLIQPPVKSFQSQFLPYPVTQMLI